MRILAAAAWVGLAIAAVILLPGWLLLVSLSMGLEGYAIFVGGRAGKWAATLGATFLGGLVAFLLFQTLLVWSDWYYRAYMWLMPGIPLLLGAVTALAALEAWRKSRSALSAT